jgi:phosphopentomutase
LIMINLVDFDMLWGHRNNPEGFYQELQRFDRYLPEILNFLQDNDLLIITADHGNDPTTPSTDHSREYVPLLIFGKSIVSGIEIQTPRTFADLGNSIADALNLEDCKLDGSSFWHQIST